MLKRNLIVVDVEADGPCPGLFSIVCFGAVCVNDVLEGRTTAFYGMCAPLPKARSIPEALAVSGFTREQHRKLPHSLDTFAHFSEYLARYPKPVFVSDNPVFDWQFINYYFALYDINNPFGFSARRIGDFYAGVNKNWDDHSSWKKLRTTSHDHNPVNDARGNAEALIKILESTIEI